MMKSLRVTFVSSKNIAERETPHNTIVKKQKRSMETLFNIT